MEPLKRISLDQQAAIQYGVDNANCAAVFEVVADAPKWAREAKEIDGVLCFFTARQEISRRLPLFKLMPDTAIRHVKKLAQLGLVCYIKVGKKDFTGLTKKGQHFFSFTMSEIDSNLDSKNEPNENSNLDSNLDSSYSGKENKDLTQNKNLDSTELYLSLHKREIVSPEIEFESPENPIYKTLSSVYRNNGGTVKPRFDAKVFYIHVIQPNRVDEFARGLQNCLNKKHSDGTALQTFENFVRDGAWEGHDKIVVGPVVVDGAFAADKPKPQQTCHHCPDPAALPNGLCIACNSRATS